MPWPFSESIKKRACRYLLQRYLGHFLQEKLSLEQLSLDLYQGTGSLAQVPLDKWVRAAGGQAGGRASLPSLGRVEGLAFHMGGIRALPGQGLGQMCCKGRFISFLASLRPRSTCSRSRAEVPGPHGGSPMGQRLGSGKGVHRGR